MIEKRQQFVREVAGVVLGVLIALGIGEAADALRWKFRAETSMESIRSELSLGHLNLLERIAYQDCLDERLAQIGRILGAARTTGVLPEVRMLGNPNPRLFGTAAFDVAKSEGAPLHMEQTEARSIANSYALIEMFRNLQEQERRNWGTLKLLEGPGGPVSDNLLTALLEAWGDAKANAWLMKPAAQQSKQMLVELGVPVAYVEEVPNHAALVDRVKEYPLCKPILGGDVPSVTNPSPK